MAKKISQNIARQIGQLARETVGEIGKQPGEMAETAMEQLGVPPPKPSLEKPKNVELEQLKKQKTIQTREQIAQLEREIRQVVADRKEQQEAWRQAQEKKMASKKGPAETKEPTPVVSGKPKRGLSRPELVSRRVGG